MIKSNLSEIYPAALFEGTSRSIAWRSTCRCEIHTGPSLDLASVPGIVPARFEEAAVKMSKM
uniref:Uncharacterized protein n=1 Tax=Bradyrhizobium ottawaense TaxID=931866 RepID=A0A2U8PA88_9BRAD|nr:hypothetical protein CIT37_22865 [Bradyrhizobium ottawaense]